MRNFRDLVVYLPPSYDENTLKPYNNILVMHDGQNLFNDSTSYLGYAWHCQDTVNEQVVAGTMEEIIIVGVDNTDNRNNELTFCYDTSEKMGTSARVVPSNSFKAVHWVYILILLSRLFFQKFKKITHVSTLLGTVLEFLGPLLAELPHVMAVGFVVIYMDVVDVCPVRSGGAMRLS